VVEAPRTSLEALIFDYFCFWNVAAPVEGGTSGKQHTPSVHVCTVTLFLKCNKPNSACLRFVLLLTSVPHLFEPACLGIIWAVAVVMMSFALCMCY
jgi:hypothetical protein